MNLPERTAWLMTGAVIAVMVVSILSLLGWLGRAGLLIADMPSEGRVFLLLFFGAPLALGIALAWRRMAVDRRERRARARALDMSPPEGDA